MLSEAVARLNKLAEGRPSALDEAWLMPEIGQLVNVVRPQTLSLQDIIVAVASKEAEEWWIPTHKLQGHKFKASRQQRGRGEVKREGMVRAALQVMLGEAKAGGKPPTQWVPPAMRGPWRKASE